ncbi:MAG: response regulator [Desulfatibacillaceae bacterium]
MAGKKVLVVDDFATTRRIIANMIKSMGYGNVVEADNGETARDVLERDTVGLVISDWDLPGMNGMELLERIRGSYRHSGIPFIMATTNNEKDKIIEATKKGASGYLVKPFEADELAKKVRMVMN